MHDYLFVDFIPASWFFFSTYPSHKNGKMKQQAVPLLLAYLLSHARNLDRLRGDGGQRMYVKNSMVQDLCTGFTLILLGRLLFASTTSPPILYSMRLLLGSLCHHTFELLIGVPSGTRNHVRFFIRLLRAGNRF